jgi:ubiquitin C-terminal hydrolase
MYLFISPSYTVSILQRASITAARVNTLDVPAYRVYTLEELQEATNNFSSSKLINSDTVQFVSWRRLL